MPGGGIPRLRAWQQSRWVVHVSDRREVGGQSVLIVEDEPLIAWSLADMGAS